MANRISRVGDEALTRLLETEPIVAVTYEFMFQSPKNPYEQKEIYCGGITRIRWATTTSLARPPPVPGRSTGAEQVAE